MGSGSLAAIAVFEEGYKDDLEEGEAVELVKRAILAGVWNDLGSGSNVDTCVIRMDGSVEQGRNCVMPNEVKELRSKVVRSDVLNMRSGTTAVLGERFRKRMGGGITLEDVVVTEMET
jgi:20S proteasome subunit beta 2